MRITNLRKSYQVSGHHFPVLEGLNLEVADQGITVVLGRSGCGKTTLLRLVAGLEEADSGQIQWESRKDADQSAGQENTDAGQNRQSRGTSARSGACRIGVIFQEPRLMPWLTVERNILFGVRDRTRGQEMLPRLLELTGLAGFEKARPGQLSGGMQQRVALARALAYGPDYLLMDEPFAALDYFTRAQMQQELLKIYQTERKGILFVTHSIEEALTIGTHIVVLEGGVCGIEYHLETAGFPRDLLSTEMIRLKRELISRIEEPQKAV